MTALSDIQISRQDHVDNQIFQLLQTISPSQQPIEWNIEMIGDIRDTIEMWIVDKMKVCTEKDFYPYVEEENGDQRNSN
jgi:hypothetical protein